ncbi:lipoyl(octanoyl) transferase LipB [Alicyclobacillus acidiphilus]|uniref:lipoyl(octanoyl) transferase LipB n=1 Tax=Alicyclobacillus acidiphilus TaxID=182455 RepID=UPI000ADC878B|nr:lipoyl(octanoyl) transferase LipB [Alicyclobacillus acidiphilus]
MTVEIEWRELGTMHYDEALRLQMDQASALLNGGEDRQAVFVVEHPRTITIGRNGSFANVVKPVQELEALGFTIREVDRGGDVTYHGPGQLVVYPVLHLAPWDNDVSAYVRKLEEVVIRSLAEVGIVGERVEAYPGVWVGENKICAVGARVKRRSSGEFVTYHGFALNINTQLDDFATIVPCGIHDKGVTSIQKELGALQDFQEWAERIQRIFLSVFNAVVSPEVKVGR